MKKLLIAAFIVAVPTLAQAQPQKLNAAQINDLLSDKTIYSLKGTAPAEQLFQKAGATYYAENDNQSQGQWKVQGDQYCSVWPPSENWVCYDMTLENDIVSFISPSGKTSSYQLHK